MMTDRTASQPRHSRFALWERLRALLLLPAALGLALSTATTRDAAGQDVMRIAAVVNDDIISIWDVENRMRLIAMASGTTLTNETRRRLAPQVLRNLIDDRLRLQEAKRLSIRVSERDVRRSIEALERRNNLPKGAARQVLAQNGIDYAVLESQQEALVAWREIIQRRLTRQIDVGDDEIDEELRRLEAVSNLPQSLVSEIYLSVDTPEQEREIRANALRLIEQIRSGASFGEIARSFSQSATAAVGGDLGWVFPGQLDEELDKTISAMKPGQLSQPIRDFSGYHILLVRDRRVVGAADPKDIKISMAQVLLPNIDGAPPVQQANDVLAQASSCDDFIAAGKAGNATIASRLDDLVVGDLQESMANTVAGLEPGQAAEPVAQRSGLLLVMLCSRSEPELALPSRGEIEERIGQSRLDLLARRYLRDLRRAAFVDIRV